MKALLALEEGVVDGRTAKCAIRFALAYLYAVGNGERWLFDSYWVGYTGAAGKAQASTYLAGVVCDGGLEAALNGIYRSVGVERTVAMLDAAHKAIGPRSKRGFPSR